MDALRIEAYLRSACSVLNFDIGELWVARRLKDQGPTLRFIQLYTTPDYQDFHNLLVRPTCPANQTEEKHRFSPIICRCVCDGGGQVGGQIVWANTRKLEGLVGSTDVPLNTAVGMPICSVGGDLCILVLFAVHSIPMTPNAIEFLLSIARAASSSGDEGFVPASLSTPVTAPNNASFVGLWDMQELLHTYSRDVAFHLMPIGKLQAFLDYKETNSLVEFFNEFKQVRDKGFNQKQLQALQKGSNHNLQLLLKYGRDRSLSESSTSSTFWFNSDETSSEETSSITSASSSVSSAPSSKDENTSSFSEDDGGPGAFALELDDASDDSAVSSNSLITAQSMYSVPIDSRSSYKQDPSRFHEFMVAILGMTIFHAAELWFVSEKSAQPELYVVAALYRDKALQGWTTQAKDLRLKAGQDLPGQILKTAQPYWDGKYNTHGDKDAADGVSSNIRSALAAEIGIHTAFGVPLPGPRGVSGVLALYSKQVVQPEPLMVSMVQKAAQILSAGALDLKMLASIDIESIVYNPNALLQSWTCVGGDEKRVTAMQSPSLAETVVKVNFMGTRQNLVAGQGDDPNIEIGPESHKRSSSGRKRFADALLAEDGFEVLDSFPAFGGDRPKKSKRGGVSAGASSSARVCKIQDCGNVASSRSPYCSDHAGTRRCQFGVGTAAECTKCAQGATRFCLGHGGGRRCTFPGCDKGARDKFFCAGHGGGRRCTTPGCTKSAVGGSGHCTAHGGGKRCQFKGCGKSAQSSTSFCVRHGGGRKCIAPGCTKVARGRTEYCAAHGGARAALSAADADDGEEDEADEEE